MKTFNITKSNITIGLLIEIEGLVDVEGYKTALRNGITKVAEEHNINLLCFAGGALHRSPYNFNEEQRNIIYDFISPDLLDGILIVSTIGSFTIKNEFNNFLDNFKNIPKVFIGGKREDMPSIYIDNTKGMKELLQHLIKQHKYKKFAFIKGPDENKESILRLKIFKEQLKKHNLPFDKNLIISGNFLINSGIVAVKKLLAKKKSKFDCIVASNDHMALGALSELDARGISVPEQLALTGFDDSIKAHASTPSLTTVGQPVFEMGVKATELLISQINGDNINNEMILPSKLIIRQSCGCFDDIIINKSSDIKYSDKEKKSLNLTLNQLKEKIENDVIRNYHTHIFNKELISGWIDELLNEFSNYLSIEKYNSNKILLILNKIIKFTKSYEFDLKIWESIFNSFYNNLNGIFKDCGTQTKIENIFKEARILISENEINIEAFKRLKSELQLEVLYDISQSFFTKNHVHEIMEILANELPRLNIHKCFISLYKENTVKSNSMKLPEWSKLVLASDDNGQINIEEEGRFYQTYELIPDYSIFKQKTFSLIIVPLFFGTIQLGFAIFEQGPKNGIVYEMLRTQISNALYVAKLYLERKKAEENLIETLKELEYTNKKLSSLSLKDELTGLYNRRGFLTHAKQHLNLAKQTHSKFLLFFADLEGLKKINDNYGHSEGDFAILNAAKILKETFHEADIIARIGGDEFTILAINKSSKDISGFKNKIFNKIKKLNSSSKKPYEIGIIIGATAFDNNTELTFEELMNEADKELYRTKKIT